MIFRRVCIVLVCVLLGVICAAAWFNPTAAKFQDTRQGNIKVTTADSWPTSSEKTAQPEPSLSSKPVPQPTVSIVAEPEPASPSISEPSELPTSDVSIHDPEGEQQ